jgi:hypothetical protein
MTTVIRTRPAGNVRAVGISTGSAGRRDALGGRRDELDRARASALRAPSERPMSTRAPHAAANAGEISPNRDALIDPAPNPGPADARRPEPLRDDLARQERP